MRDGQRDSLHVTPGRRRRPRSGRPRLQKPGESGIGLRSRPALRLLLHQTSQTQLTQLPMRARLHVPLPHVPGLPAYAACSAPGERCASGYYVLWS